MVSQRKFSELQGFEIETTDDAGIRSKAAYELASIQVRGSLNLSYILRDHNNYLQGKRQTEMAYGQIGSMLISLCIFKINLVRIRHSNMRCKWTEKNK